MTEMGIILLYSLITVVSFVLCVVTILSYRRYKIQKLIFISMVFFFFFIRATLLSIGLFVDQIGLITTSGYFWVVDLLILLLLYVAYSVKR
jgi:hypothetical protein